MLPPELMRWHLFLPLLLFLSFFVLELSLRDLPPEVFQVEPFYYLHDIPHHLYGQPTFFTSLFVMFVKPIFLAGLFASVAVNALPQYGSSSSNSGCSSGDCGSSSSSSSGYSGSYSGSSSSDSSSSMSSDCGSSGCVHQR
ncbi:hypothetical protein GYMLUDRAFT_664708 [Collybiopsis luxurians FD-317 M1]|uniref:Uncharacterized protein n=1 Tax=Collybiopsis luxurians FD-317 M1 TaxID=944289 RepID=A0A0D0BWB4_9AGAR|nr:hypothetical protein GYMLUDRAFT_664708 [Collybiopsis luxurians FD-317 M1]